MRLHRYVAAVVVGRLRRRLLRDVRVLVELGRHALGLDLLAVLGVRDGPGLVRRFEVGRKTGLAYF